MLGTSQKFELDSLLGFPVSIMTSRLPTIGISSSGADLEISRPFLVREPCTNFWQAELRFARRTRFFHNRAPSWVIGLIEHVAAESPPSTRSARSKSPPRNLFAPHTGVKRLRPTRRRLRRMPRPLLVELRLKKPCCRRRRTFDG